MYRRPTNRFLPIIALAALMALSAGCAHLAAKKHNLSPPQYQVQVERNIMVPMSDGTLLATDAHFPRGLYQAPVILIRTPYGKNKAGRGAESVERLLVQRGYIVVVQDVRGRYGSEGEFYPFIHDGRDGRETMAWVREQPWYGGRLGTFGGSYLGTTQWFAAPGEDIAAMHLAVTSPDLKEVIYTGGELHLMTVYFWGMMIGERSADKAAAVKLALNLNRYISVLPAGMADDAIGRDVEFFNDALDPVRLWDIYRAVDFEDRYREVSAPAVFVAGWYDMFLGPQLNDFNRLREQGGGNAAQSVLIVGPWGHGAGGDGSVDFGPEARRRDIRGPRHVLAWFDHWLKGAEGPGFPPVRIFVMGDNAWRDENEWPLARTVYTDYYLRSGGRANTRAGDGTLSTEPPGPDEPADEFVYDPLDPVPTLGGNNLGLNLGAHNQARVEDREDVLCYTGPVLESDLEVTGPVRAALYAASDAVDTNFTVKLVDARPDGKVVNVQDGTVRAMYRRNDPNFPTPLTPGEVEEYEIDLWATSYVFKAGHRVRVEVSSSNFPRFNRNLNTGEPPLTAERAVPARQTIHHDALRPSRIILPVIPR